MQPGNHEDRVAPRDACFRNKRNKMNDKAGDFMHWCFEWYNVILVVWEWQSYSYSEIWWWYICVHCFVLCSKKNKHGVKITYNLYNFELNCLSKCERIMEEKTPLMHKLCALRWLNSRPALSYFLTSQHRVFLFV